MLEIQQLVFSCTALCTLETGFLHVELYAHRKEEVEGRHEGKCSAAGHEAPTYIVHCMYARIRVEGVAQVSNSCV